MRGKRFALSAIGALVLAAAAPAQKLEVGPDALTAGGEASVGYEDPSKAGETVLVEIDNGDPSNLLYDNVLVYLDGNGKGSATWDVPEGGWDLANFMAPGVPTKQFPVNPGPPPPPPPPPPGGTV